MQKGFASAEILIAALIISLLATVAVPNAARLFDRAAVNYEQKRLYSELYFVRTLNRSATFSSTGMNNATRFLSSKVGNNKSAELELDLSNNSYKILRDGDEIREPHYLSNGVTFSADFTQIRFDTAGYANVTSKSIVLTSRRGYTKKIVFDSVGRIRGDD